MSKRKIPLPKEWIEAEDNLPKYGIKVLVRNDNPRTFGYGRRSYLEPKIINLYDTFKVVYWAYEDRLKKLTHQRTGIKPQDTVCPRAETNMMPCVIRDGDAEMTDIMKCVGCGCDVNILLENEEKK